MEHKKYEFILESQQPIAHHQETFGNTSILMRQKIMSGEDGLVDVPVITGDTMRHGLREAGSYALLKAAGIDGDLTEQALRLLFSGGVIQGRQTAISISQYKEMVDLLPHLSLLGGCAGNRVIPGKIQVDYARLICKETLSLTPEWVKEWMSSSNDVEDFSPPSCREMIAEETRTRMDPTLDTEKKELLSGAEKENVQDRLEGSEKASSKNDYDAKDREKSSMMPRSYEVIAPGARFYWAITATTHSELERDTLLVMIGSFLSNAVVGGKKGTGHGKIKALVGRELEISPSQPKGKQFALSDKKIGEHFTQHVSERSEKVKSLLEEIEA